MIFKVIKQKIKQYKKDKDDKYYAEMQETVINASDIELIQLNETFYNNMDMDKKMGENIPEILYKVAELIEDEMHKRNLKSCEDLEEERFFSSCHYSF